MARKKRRIARPTAAQKAIIDRRLRAKYPQMYRPGWGKSSSAASLLTNYASGTGRPQLRGASGSDYKELEKIVDKRLRKVRKKR